ncbi:MAG: thymidine kinase [Chitinophagales bacterium]|nr:thymidine kinase [Bacteroidota bacterium]MCB9044311.1 thymidine kinase [Chitinophagales bacterium]
MFIEPYSSSDKKGWIEVICGSMFSGKTEELIRRLKRATIANQRVEIFKPMIDKRYHAENVVSHNANSIPSTPIESATSILLLATDVDVVGIDEAQFFDVELPEVCEQLARKGIRVIIAGLDKDFSGKPFGCLPQLLAIGDYITKLHAICVVCGDLATHSFRKGSSDNKILLGEKDTYEARCRACYYKGLAEKKR